MRLSQVPCDSMFAPLHPDEFTPIFHKGKDGKIRKVSGSWNGHCTIDLKGEEEKLFANDPEIQPVYISPPVGYY